MKVILGSSEEVQILLSLKFRLAGTTTILKPDLPLEIRQKNKELYGLLRERRLNGENDLYIKNFRIVKKALQKAPVVLRAGTMV
jgi:hypothetical protein